jgi:formylglycine-generating enzyme required for sulfatase activity/serine/threonine protein phosphatase PrpC
MSASLTAEVWPVTDPGQVSTHNEDFVSVYHPDDPDERRLSGNVYVVADGSGGGVAGEVASRYAAHRVMHAYYTDDEPDLGLRLRKAVQAANFDLFRYKQSDPRLSKLSVALVASAVRGEQLHVASVGDARAYLVRGGRTLRIGDGSALTPEAAVAEDETQARPPRDAAQRALGMQEDLTVDVYDLRLKADDVLVLCSDGLTRNVKDQELADITSMMSPRSAARQLVDIANDRGGEDNATVVVALMRAGAPEVTGRLPYSWAGQEPVFDEHDTVVRPRPPGLAAAAAAAGLTPPSSLEQTVRRPPIAEPETQPEPEPEPQPDDLATEVDTLPSPLPPAEAPPPEPPRQPPPAAPYPAPPPATRQEPLGDVPPLPTQGPAGYQPRVYQPPGGYPPPPPARASTGLLIGMGAIIIVLLAAIGLLVLQPFKLPFGLGRGQGAVAEQPTAILETAQPGPTTTPQPTPVPPTETPQPETPPGTVLIPAGPFQRGVDEEEAAAAALACINESEDDTACFPEYFSDAQPRSEVQLSPFYIDQSEVTNIQYAACVAAEICDPPTDNTFYSDPAFANHPVVYVTWEMAQAYCEWEGRRLPTEAEWEKAARGTDGWLYPWGNEWEPGRANTFAAGQGGTNDTNAFQGDESPYGVRGMAGNVSEWVFDWYFPGYEGRGSVDPQGPPNPPLPEPIKVARGGSFFDISPFARTGQRKTVTIDKSAAWLGFRCAANVPGAAPAATEAPPLPTAVQTPTVTGTETPAAETPATPATEEGG